ncbi:hypothetical protein [Microbacterium sp. T32]|uniref:hypothetical protein n=1 Tax=Microbacterium sp. T32 TaxID=1776083 RepID=UPI000A908397|nr:hypothetical protein [Microbacterium sp. T32]
MTDWRPYSKEDANLMWHALSRWAKVLPAPKEVRGTNARLVEAWVRRNYVRVLAPETIAITLAKAATPLYSRTTGWIIGAPIRRENHVLPVATVSVGSAHDGISEGLAIRVALLHERKDETIVAEGWRFEQGEIEDEPPAHPYAHAQAIIGWVKHSDCLLHPPHDLGSSCTGINESGTADLDTDRKAQRDLTLVKHPAFPLGMTTMTGLAFSVISTLYGNNDARKVLDSGTVFSRVPQPIRDDFDRLCLG